MCLAVPMQVIEVDGFNARCEAKGISRSVSLFLMQHDTVQPGDYLMVHVGSAIQKISEADAKSAWELYDEMFQAEEAASQPGGARSDA
ncbi:HypC/HybG/HupF family hydrogenase formation chaperone [Mesobacterium sp. TK19101]|uniref:HypC/HybG/HupF family hydrogenase formation chaperone n=1 Tax=Mesobacterium hydrothermale TaxID=3111907 RepID=A0ABU6HK13_9RHOB|nr:HypC/HybG/HupF family hydrogenase formation chaperone [Mesobacterium sp. TK19101]MEC3862774.1 HypC/HybG/HupF family hydrogenase formation chaperone [Mesobacterium sp. TK19101]